MPEPKKTKQHEEVKGSIMLNGREAVTVSGAQDVLEKNLDKRYSRDTVYRLFIDGKIEGERTLSANFYYVDSLLKFCPSPLTERGRKPGVSTPDETMRARAIELIASGVNQSETARQIGVSRQTIRNWLKDS